MFSLFFINYRTMEISSIQSILDKSKIENIIDDPFNNRSYYGYKSSVLKSGICKYYRRGLIYKFIWCVVEMALFGLKSKSLLSNLINRLKVLIMEELVFNENMEKIVECINLLNYTETTNDLMEKLRCILTFCKIVIKLNRGRLTDYIKQWWKYNKIHFNLEIINLNKIKKFEKHNDKIELLKLGEILLNLLENKINNEGRIINIYKKMKKIKNCGNRMRRKDGVYLF